MVFKGSVYYIVKYKDIYICKQSCTYVEFRQYADHMRKFTGKGLLLVNGIWIFTEEELIGYGSWQMDIVKWLKSIGQWLV